MAEKSKITGGIQQVTKGNYNRIAGLIILLALLAVSCFFCADMAFAESDAADEQIIAETGSGADLSYEEGAGTDEENAVSPDETAGGEDGEAVTGNEGTGQAQASDSGNGENTVEGTVTDGTEITDSEGGSSITDPEGGSAVTDPADGDQDVSGQPADGQNAGDQNTDPQNTDDLNTDGQTGDDLSGEDTPSDNADNGENGDGTEAGDGGENPPGTETPEEEIPENTIELRGDGRFYDNGILMTNCWVDYEGSRYYVDAKGNICRDMLISFGQKSYFLGPDGTVQKDRLIAARNGQYYYADADGLIVKGRWIIVNGKRAYFADSNGALYRNQFISFGKIRYYMTSNGSVGRGSYRTTDGRRYFSDRGTGIVNTSSGWLSDNGRRYFAKADGTLFVNQFISFGSIRYYMLPDGSVAKGSLKTADGRQFFADRETGVVSTASGWITDGEKKYFAKPGGELYRDQFISFGKTKYYMTSDGSMAKGSFMASDGKQYMADPETGVVRENVGWVNGVSGKRYYFQPDGTMYKNQFISFGKVQYYMGEDGSVQVGLIRTSDGKLYISDENGKVITTAGWIELDGNRYYARQGGELYRKQFISFGSTYYYLGKDGSAQRGEQMICGKKYTFRDDYTLIGVPRGNSKGIDVSVFQGDIDWAQVKSSGIDFAFVRAGGRGGSSGKIYDDEKFFENVTGAISNGVHVGVYFFTQAVNAAEAVEEANYICNKTQGLNIDLPVVIDTEELYADGMSCRHNNISVEVRTAVIKAFCEQVIARGYTPMIYGSTSWLEDMLDMSKLPYDVWVAQYYKTCQYEGDYSFWQYTENGIVKGIDGYVDMNEWCG